MRIRLKRFTGYTESVSSGNGGYINAQVNTQKPALTYRIGMMINPAVTKRKYNPDGSINKSFYGL